MSVGKNDRESTSLHTHMLPRTTIFLHRALKIEAEPENNYIKTDRSHDV